MAISKKPTKQTVDVEALILKGGSVPASPSAAKNTPQPPAPVDEDAAKKVPLQLRLSNETIRQIDELIERRVIKISRHAWFIEAISEKMLKERE